MIIFLFDYCGHLVYHTSKDKFFEYQFLQKYTLFASRLRTFRSALGLRVNDVGKICPSSMLRRMTWWITFVVRPTLDSLPLGLQNFLKYDDQIQHNAFLVKMFKNLYLPVCAHSRISSGTKVVHCVHLHKILKGQIFPTSFTRIGSTGI